MLMPTQNGLAVLPQRESHQGDAWEFRRSNHRSSSRSEGWRALRNGSRPDDREGYHLAARATLRRKKDFQSSRFHRVRGARQIPLADTACDRSDFGGVRRGLQALGVCRPVKPFNADVDSARIWEGENPEHKA